MVHLFSTFCLGLRYIGHSRHASRNDDRRGRIRPTFATDGHTIGHIALASEIGARVQLGRPADADIIADRFHFSLPYLSRHRPDSRQSLFSFSDSHQHQQFGSSVSWLLKEAL